MNQEEKCLINGIAQQGKKSSEILQIDSKECTSAMRKDESGNLMIDPHFGRQTTKGYAEVTAMAIKAFPKLNADFFELLNERALDKGFSNRKFYECVKNVIDNFNYPEPTLANFLTFDKSLQLYRYDQKLKLIDELGASVANKLYKSVRINGRTKPLWAHIDDIEKYNIPLWR